MCYTKIHNAENSRSINSFFSTHSCAYVVGFNSLYDVSYISGADPGGHPARAPLKLEKI